MTSGDSLHIRSASTTTVMFTDLVGSTAMLSGMREDEGTAAHLAHLGALRVEVARYGGREVKSVGDGLMVSFSSALAAVECAVDMQRTTRRSDVQSRLRLRIGIHAGEVVLDDAQDLYGKTVVIASRLCDVAQGSQILVSALVADLVGTRGSIPFQALGGVSLKGIDAVVPVAAVRWDPDAIVSLDLPTLERHPQLPLPAVLRQYATRPLVGREAELTQLVAQLDRVTAQDRRLFALCGESGIGKTRLAAELARIAHEQGATVLFGSCEEQTLVPFSPFVTAFDYFAASLTPEHLHRRLGGGERELALLLPSLRAQVRRDGVGTSEDAEFERYRLFAAVVALVELAADSSPLVLVLDDLHWADSESLLLLKHVLRAPRQPRLLVLATYRDEEVTGSHPLTQLLTDLRRDSMWERLRLEGLDEQGVGELVRSTVGAHAPPEFAHDLWQETEGHPLFLQELIRHLVETRALSRYGRFALRRGADRGGIPEGVRDVVTDRLRRLPSATREALQAAAVIGPEFSLETLEQVADRSPSEMHTLLEPALLSRLVEALPATDGRHVFSHSLIRESLYQEMSPHHRGALHISIGEALERRPDLAIGEGHFSQLAHHFLEGGTRSATYERGIDYAIRAAEQAASALAFGKACDHLRRAVDALSGQTSREAECCQALLSLGENEWQAGEYLRSRETFARAAALAERLQRPEELARAAIGMCGRVGLQTSAPRPEVAALLTRALRMLGDEPTPLRTRVSSRLALALIGDSRRRDELCREAIDQARGHGDDALLAEVLLFAGWAQWSPDNLGERLSVADEIVSRAECSGSIPLRLEARFWRIAHLLEAGELRLYDADYTELQRLTEEARQPYHLWLVAIIRAMRATAFAVDATALDLIWRAFRIGEAAQNSAAMEAFSAQLLVAYGLADRTEEFFPAARTMTEYFQTVPAFHAGLAVTYCQLGRLRDAEPLFERLAEDDFRGVPRNWQWLSTMDMLCEICWRLGDRARAAVLLELMTPFAERVVVLGAWAAPRGVAARGLGLLELLLGRHNDAVRRLRRAVELNARLGIQSAESVAQLDLARALLARGAPQDQRAAEELVAEVESRATLLGLHAVASDATTLGRTLSDTEGPVMPAAAPRPLRERASMVSDVARSALSTRGRALMARGLTQVTDDQLERRFSHPLAQRALFAAMARTFQPRLAFGFHGELGFELYSKVTDSWEWWTLDVQGDRVNARRRPSREPAMILRMSVADFVRLLTGQLNAIGLWIEQRMVVEGDILMGSRLVDMFGGVSLLEALPGTEDPPRQF